MAPAPQSSQTPATDTSPSAPPAAAPDATVAAGLPLSRRTLPELAQALLWPAVGLGLLALLWLLSPILTPFLLATIFAYIGNPLVQRLTSWGVPRVVGAVLTLALFIALVVALMLILLPVLLDEGSLLVSRLPDLAALANEKLAPWLRETFGFRLRLDAAGLKRLLADNADSLQAFSEKLLASVRIGGIALLGIAANLLLVPVVLFYLLLEWHPLMARLEKAIPRPWHGRAMAMARELDHVLSQFLRGQLSVMALLAGYYAIGLTVAGLPSAVPVGILTGLLIFIPYLGYATGLTLALLLALLQFAGWQPVIGVAVVYGIGQVLEGFLLTPYLVGERIGLHPLAVIFALLAFGQVFGFFGVLVALPAAAALLVALRALRGAYFRSHFYLGPPETKP